MNRTIKDSTIYKNADRTAKLILLNAEQEAIQAGKHYYEAEWQVFEIYVFGGPDMVSGWEIELVVVPGNVKEATEMVKSFPNFDCIITRNDYYNGNVIGFKK